MLFGGGARRDEELAAYGLGVEEAIADTIATLIKIPRLDDGTRRLLAHGIVDLAEGARATGFETARAIDPDELAGQVADVAWAGLRGHRLNLGQASASPSARQPTSGKPAAPAAAADAWLSSSWT